MTHPVLTTLGLGASESGTYLGHGEWSKTSDAGVLEPINPTTGEVLGRVMASSQADYDLIVERAQAAFKTWLADRPHAWREGVEVVAMDGFTGFKTAAAEELPTAVAVMDPSLAATT